jgi:7,8-dihydroneopterin aldolase/epimerase/oxygenase
MAIFERSEKEPVTIKKFRHLLAMALISIEGMRFRAFHGLYPEERILGTDFLLDVWVDTDINKASVVVEHDTEKVDNTVNYQTIYDICDIEMRQPQQLLETVVGHILFRLKYQFSKMFEARVRVRKLNPPVGGQVEWSSVFEIKNFRESCGRCGSGMICYKMQGGRDGVKRDGTCWCEQPDSHRDTVHPRTLEMLEGQHKGCMCEKCLREFAG